MSEAQKPVPPTPREWFLNTVAGYRCEVNEDGIGLTGNEVHVVEYAAFEAVQKERDELQARYDELLKLREFQDDFLTNPYLPEVGTGHEDSPDQIADRQYSYRLGFAEGQKERDALAAELAIQDDANEILTRDLAEAKERIITVARDAKVLIESMQAELVELRSQK